MFYRLFASLLMSLIAGQSVLAAADTHLDVQPGNDHQQTNHSHSTAMSSADGEDNLLHTLVDAVSDHEAGHSTDGAGNDGEQSVDCQHCCHCHNGSQVLASVFVQPALVALGTGSFSYVVRPNSLKFPPALRPPIV
jgi:hypothetical protein